jgi:hypothetical protein
MLTQFQSGKSEGKGPFERPAREDYVKRHLKINNMWGSVDIHLAQDRITWWGVLNAIVDLRVTYKKREIY